MLAPMHAKHQQRDLGTDIRNFGARQHGDLPSGPHPIHTEIALEPWLSKLKSPAKLNHHAIRWPLEMIFVVVRIGRRSISAYPSC